MRRTRSTSALLLAASLLLSWMACAQSDRTARFPAMSRAAEERGLAEPFKGITTNGDVVKGLFPLRSTGVSTEPVRIAAEKFLAALTEEQRRKTLFPVDDLEWRKWMNVSFYIRQGVGFGEMSEAQREAAFGLMRASFSAKGMKLSRDIMKLNRDHIHAVVRTPNGNDYGKDLLRQHYAAHPH